VPLFRRGTSLYDALLTAVRCSEKKDGYTKCIIAFTDGADTTKSSPAEVITAAKNASVPIFLIGIGNVEESILKSIADSTGGKYYPVSDT